jgi:Zn-dependent protease
MWKYFCGKTYFKNQQGDRMILFWAGLIGIFIMSVVFHEVAHGAVAFVLGDRTAKSLGRLTLNPIRHIDWFWTILFPTLLFISTHGRFMIGMAKPVPVNFGNLRHPKRDMVFVSLAGPIANIIFAQFLLVAFKLTGVFTLLLGVYFNVGLAAFNLLPVPPMDGSRILIGILPRPLDLLYLKLEPYGFIIVLILYFTGLLYAWIIPTADIFTALLGVPKLTDVVMLK